MLMNMHEWYIHTLKGKYYKWPSLICCVLWSHILTLPCCECDSRWGWGELELNKTTAKNAQALCHSLCDLQSLLFLQEPLLSQCITCVSCCHIASIMLLSVDAATLVLFIWQARCCNRAPCYHLMSCFCSWSDSPALILFIHLNFVLLPHLWCCRCKTIFCCCHTRIIAALSACILYVLMLVEHHRLLLLPHILKGVWHEIFNFRFFSWMSVPQASKYSIGAFLNFFENWRRINVYHRCQRHRW